MNLPLLDSLGGQSLRVFETLFFDSAAPLDKLGDRKVIFCGGGKCGGVRNLMHSVK